MEGFTSANDNYFHFLQTEFDLADVLFVQDLVRNAKQDVSKIFDAYQSAIRMYVVAYSSTGKDLSELIRLCHNVFLKVLEGNCLIEGLKKYLEFCSEWDEKEDATEALLTNYFPKDFSAWKTAIIFYRNRHCHIKSDAIIEEAKKRFTLDKDRLAIESSRLENSLKTEVHTGIFTVGQKQRTQYLTCLTYATSITPKYYEELLLYLADLDYPTNNLMCKILQDASQRFPREKIGMFSKICFSVEHLIEAKQLVPAAVALEARKRFSEILEQATDDLVKLYFHFLNRIRLESDIEIDWFERIVQLECSWLNQMEHWSRLKYLVQFDTLNQIWKMQDKEKRVSIPLMSKIMDYVLERFPGILATKEVMQGFCTIAVMNSKNDELQSFFFKSWIRLFKCRYNNDQLEYEIIQMARLQKDRVGYLALYLEQQEKGIEATRDLFKSMQLSKQVLEYMIELELAQNPKNFQMIRSCYALLAGRLRSASPDSKEMQESALDVLLNWADFENSNGGHVTRVNNIARDFLIGAQYEKYCETWNWTRLRYRRVEAADLPGVRVPIHDSYPTITM